MSPERTMDLFDGPEQGLPFQLPDGGGCEAYWNEIWQGYNIIVPGGELFYVEDFFGPKISDRCVEYFQENNAFDWRRVRWKDLTDDEFAQTKFTNINWQHENIRLYGKTTPLPRLSAWYGDRGAAYTYSGLTATPNAWNKGLLYLKQHMERCAGAHFNSVLLNWYRDGQDHVSWHADNEAELGHNPVIGSASFGATRDFVVRRKDDKGMKLVLPLKHGSVLIMRDALQRYWEHALPKRARVTESRFNLTFRFIAEGDD